MVITLIQILAFTLLSLLLLYRLVKPPISAEEYAKVVKHKRLIAIQRIGFFMLMATMAIWLWLLVKLAEKLSVGCSAVR